MEELISKKYLIVGATGSVGSSLAEQLCDSNKEVHLVARDEVETKSLSKKLNSSYSIANVLDDDFVDKIKSDIEDIKGITLVSASTLENSIKKTIKDEKIHFAKCIGQEIAKRSLKKGITEVVFDKGKYKYHGNIKILADSARESGLVF